MRCNKIKDSKTYQMVKWMFIWCVGFFVLLGACSEKNDLGEIDFLNIEGDSLLNEVFEHAEKYEVQIRYVQINRDEDGVAELVPYEFRVDSSAYFYPASSAKMPVAFLALEKLNQLYKQNIDVDFNTALEIDAERVPPQTAVLYDSSSIDFRASIGHYIHKLFLVSDNDAYNRLYEFVGPEAINKEMRSKGIFRNSRIVHRLSAPAFNEEENRHTNSFRFFDGERTVYSQPAQYMEAWSFEKLKNTSKGRGYINGNNDLVSEPFDFSNKNFIALRDLQESLISVIMQDGKLDLRAEDYQLLYKSMSMYPGESLAPIYEGEQIFDSSVKYFMFGDTKESIPEHIRIFNKIGGAYGYLTDCAYIVDFKNNIEFFLAATIHVNSNQVFNDDQYEYNEVGIPFLAALGRKFYEYELGRTRNKIPDLSRFKMVYK
ncbi:serine hydrolase [Portibacter lacus]|uniref:Beta-lactamase class A catalytic domain-containing protein n=1 Tax=Portibacter lacus TaxID=1099794 RepID=A0AA37WG59_9BACT|nr:serine hydrolase [Portibacter lacus]GLR17715.1 hypothetical protein GCM10007940_23300 [Portibacter lacus]